MLDFSKVRASVYTLLSGAIVVLVDFFSQDQAI